MVAGGIADDGMDGVAAVEGIGKVLDDQECSTLAAAEPRCLGIVRKGLAFR